MNPNGMEVKNIKLYISCINECPIKGRISTTNIIRELVSYYYEYDDITNIAMGKHVPRDGWTK